MNTSDLLEQLLRAGQGSQAQQHRSGMPAQDGLGGLGGLLGGLLGGGSSSGGGGGLGGLLQVADAERTDGLHDVAAHTTQEVLRFGTRRSVHRRSSFYRS